MGEKSLIFIIGILIAISCFNLVSAGFELGSPAYDIETTYGPGEKLSGWISIKLTNESNFSTFEDSEGNSMALIELINENPDFIFEVNSEGNLNTSYIQHLNLGNGSFYLPSTIGSIDYQFNYSEIEIFSEQINITATEDINATLNEKEDNLNAIKAEIETYDLFFQIALESALNISYLETELARLKSNYENASTEEEFDDISVDLAKLKIPSEISTTATADYIAIFPQTENVNLDFLETIAEGTYEMGREEEYQNAIVGWDVNNLDIRITYNEFSGNYDNTMESIVNIFEFEINKKQAIEYLFYFIIPNLEEVQFKQDYQEKIQGNYTYIDLVGDKTVIAFSTTEDIDFVSLPFFISPAISELGVEDFDYEADDSEQQESRRKTIFILAIILVVIFGFILYLVLQTWYKRRYENYLFPNKNDLYNLANYIANAKKRGLDNSQVAENLRRSGWSSEQIRYALRKYSGKRTGMYEIPLKKALEKKEQKEYPGYGYRRYP